MTSKQRLSLKDAADVLELSENGVRSRYKMGKLEGERDNTGKIWVFVDPNPKSSKVTLKPSKKSKSPDFEPASNLSKRLINLVEEELHTLRTERDALKAQIASQAGLQEEAARARVEMAKLETSLNTAQTTITELRERLDASKAERQELMQALLRALEKPQERRWRLFGWFRPTKY